MIQTYFQTLWQILVHPVRFFKALPESRGLSKPLAFALVTHWIGSALEFLWNAIYFNQWDREIRDSLDRWISLAEQWTGQSVETLGRGSALDATKDYFISWFAGMGSVLMDPFITLFWILGTAVFVFVGARLLVSPTVNSPIREITFASAVQIVAYGMSPTLLKAIPVYGGWISRIYVVVITVIAAREIYRIGSFRAFIIAVFPKILFVGAVLLPFLAIVALFAFFFFSNLA